MMPLVQWLGHTGIAQGIHNSAWLFPFIEIFHLLALALLGGSVILVDLRFFGLGMTQKPLPELSRDIQPWLRLSLAVMLASGFLLFMSEAAKMYTNEAFRFKMFFLALALIFTFAVHPRFTRTEEKGSRITGRLVALTSMALWACVGLGGRAIGFV
jgi:putative copper export protein